ncbi:hypothetical protein L596_002255 [Steinernema carpocapsae]|uniref:Uncharacterized protein n=1 Tax=Steinernema carpocapsae TaxID=34508 RepID=A0A4U8UP65_STECR|nr:hypothetical protein L596_002255 [Steinernema carpocapsae]
MFLRRVASRQRIIRRLRYFVYVFGMYTMISRAYSCIPKTHTKSACRDVFSPLKSPKEAIVSHRSEWTRGVFSIKPSAAAESLQWRR